MMKQDKVLFDTALPSMGCGISRRKSSEMFDKVLATPIM